MRIPLSLSEIVTIRSLFRIFFAGGTIFLVLLAVYALTTAMERAFAPPSLASDDGSNPSSEAPPSLTAPTPPLSFARRIWNELAGTPTDPAGERQRAYQENVEEEEGYAQLVPRVLRFSPHETFLESADGRVLWVALLQRPDTETIVFRRLRDGMDFTLPMTRLAPDARALIRQFPVASPAPESAEEPTKTLTGARSFPHSCQIQNREGTVIDVTLLRRPDFRQITFRRRSDHQVFTILIDDLTDADQTLARLFPVESP